MHHEEDTLTKMEVAPPLDLEAARQKGILDNQEYVAKKKLDQAKKVDDMIAFLQANREHIGALLTTIVPFEGTVLVDPETGKTSDGLTSRACVHNLYADLGIKRTQDSFARINSNPLGFLGSILG